MYRVISVMLAMVVLLTLTAGVVAAGNSGKNFVAHMAGVNQVPTAVDTQAQGQTLFKLSKDGNQLYYKVIVANIDNVVGTHIHLATVDQNGPIILSMVPDTAGFLATGPFIPAPGVTVNGVLVEGTATAADLVGPLVGHPLTDLIDAMRAGNTYVNVHTVEYAPGEIRGQIW